MLWNFAGYKRNPRVRAQSAPRNLPEDMTQKQLELADIAQNKVDLMVQQ